MVKFHNSGFLQRNQEVGFPIAPHLTTLKILNSGVSEGLWPAARARIGTITRAAAPPVTHAPPARTEGVAPLMGRVSAHTAENPPRSWESRAASHASRQQNA